MCRSIKEDSSDLVVSMLCFALVLLPESVEEILLKASSERNFRQKIVAVHLSFKVSISKNVFHKFLLKKFSYSKYFFFF